MPNQRGATKRGQTYTFSGREASRRLKELGGFSMQRTTGKSPSRGFMVSDFGSEEIVSGHANPREIETYRQAHKNPTPVKRYVGGWHDEGKTYLDQSRNVLSAKKAHTLGQQQAQRAVYNVGRGEVRRVHHGGPVDVRGTLFEGQQGPAKELRLGNSAAVRQRTEMALQAQMSAMTQRMPSVPTKAQKTRQLKLFR